MSKTWCISSHADFVLSYVFTVFESIQLHGGDPAVQAPRHDHLQGGQFALYLLQVCYSKVPSLSMCKF